MKRGTRRSIFFSNHHSHTSTLQQAVLRTVAVGFKPRAEPCELRSSFTKASISARAVRIGLITYMRTDSVQRFPGQAQSQARKYREIRNTALNYLP